MSFALKPTPAAILRAVRPGQAIRKTRRGGHIDFHVLAIEGGIVRFQLDGKVHEIALARWQNVTEWNLGDDTEIRIVVKH